MNADQILTRLGWDQHQIEDLQIRCMKEGKVFALEARSIQRQAMRDGAFPDPVARFLRVMFELPARRVIWRVSRWLPLIFMMLPIVSPARVGESRDACIKRYGDPVASDSAAGWDSFVKAGVRVKVWYYQECCDKITYAKIDDSQLTGAGDFSDYDYQLILQANGDGRAWVKASGALALMFDYVTERDWLYASRSNLSGTVEIVTADRRRREKEERDRQKNSPSTDLKGF